MLNEIDFRGASFEDAIFNYMKDNYINKITFKLHFGGGYSLKFIKHNKYIGESLHIFTKDKGKEILERLNINDKFEILKTYETPLIKTLEIKEAWDRLNNKNNMELMTVYYDSMTLFNLFVPDDLKKTYIFLLKDILNDTNNIKEVQNTFNQIVNNSFMDVVDFRNLTHQLNRIQREEDKA